MKHKLSHLFFSLLLISATTTIWAQPALEMPVGIDFKLENGLKVIVIEQPEAGDVYLELFVDRPPIMEGEVVGIGQMVGMMLNSIARTSAQEIAQNHYGLRLNFTDRGATGWVPTKSVATLMRLLGEILDTPGPDFTTDLTDSAYGSLMSAQQLMLNYPPGMANRVGERLTFGAEHPYGELITEATLRNIKPSYFERFFRRYFRPSVSTLVLVGNIVPRDARRLLEAHLGNWEGQGKMLTELFLDPPSPSAMTVNFISVPADSSSWLQWNGSLRARPGNADWPQIKLLESLFLGRLKAAVTQSEQFTEDTNDRLYVWFEKDPILGRFKIGLSTPAEATVAGIELVRAQAQALRSKLVSQRELTIVKAELLANLSYYMNEPQQLARNAYEVNKYGLHKNYYGQYLSAIETCTPAQLLEIAQDYLDLGKTHLVVVGQPELVEELRPFAPKGQVNYYGPDGSYFEPIGFLKPEQATPASIFEHYAEAIGGNEKLWSVADISLRWKMTSDGQVITVNENKKGGDKMTRFVLAAGDTASTIRVNEEGFYQDEMGNERTHSDSERRELREALLIFPELHYLDVGYDFGPVNSATINGESAYKIDGEADGYPLGSWYYDTETGLKLRQVIQRESIGTSVTADFMDYRRIDGILLPHRIVWTLNTGEIYTSELLEAVINPGLEDADFEVE